MPSLSSKTVHAAIPSGNPSRKPLVTSSWTAVLPNDYVRHQEPMPPSDGATLLLEGLTWADRYLPSRLWGSLSLRLPIQRDQEQSGVLEDQFSFWVRQNGMT